MIVRICRNRDRITATPDIGPNATISRKIERAIARTARRGEGEMVDGGADQADFSLIGNQIPCWHQIFPCNGPKNSLLDGLGNWLSTPAESLACQPRGSSSTDSEIAKFPAISLLSREIMFGDGFARD
jgi:hypothetical protein